ncbi:c-type cytochrome [Octadecabacter ascidiaceicola]|uniref:Cytochrome c n=1 Tax=Octadecabacter ascidiaceicola TaxID=1655543 RepID=A0A238KAA6_9RHOB|nr:cytochrome c [Octadecabacter ascidiaceicola]SMX39818.1 Cytochrome c [Octadecabacter ascidiaceicola]
MKTRLIACVFGVTAIVLAAAVWAQNEPPAQVGLFEYSNAEVVAEGEALYVDLCASCHGANLEGQDNWRNLGPNGRALAPPHDETGHTWHHPDEQLFQIVKVGTAALVGNGYESDMAGYSGILSDAQILAVMAFIKSTWPEDIIERHNAINAAAAQ